MMAMKQDYAALRTVLGDSGAADRVAREMVSSLDSSFKE